jgi:hypothetical protein
LQLRNVRLHGTADGLRARQRFETALADVTPAAVGVAPQALLIVRRLAPKARLRLDPAARSGAFGQTVRADLEQCARRAARPAIDPAGAGAVAVLFADEAELISCLLRDWLGGSLGERWWWPAVLRGLSPSEWGRRAVLPRGDLLPAVLLQLAIRGQAVAWLLRLSESEAADAFARVATAHALQSGSETRPAAPDKSHSISQSPGRWASHWPASPARSFPASVDARRRLTEIVPEAETSGLTAAQRRLLAVALGLHRAPAWTRGPQFAAALASLELEAAAFTALADVIGAAEPEISSSDVSPLLPPSPQARPQTAAGDIANSAEGAKYEAFNAPASEHSGSAWGAASPAPAPSPENAVEGPAAMLPRAPPLAATPSDGSYAVVLPARLVETRFGGIFYLLNAALALGLYSDFTQPRMPGIALSPWDWLALIGRAWFGREFARDKVWELLSELAGRSPRQRPGCHFAAPESWSVPAEWLDPWGEVEVVRVYATRRRLQLWHDAGFVLNDTARADGFAPLAQARTLRAESEALHQAKPLRVRRLPHRLAGGPVGSDAVGAWLRWVMLYLQARLARALGTDEAASVATLVCRHAAKLTCTATALDVHLSLADLPIEIRLAGLDRDPGWIPAAGRSISFHFA